MKEFLEAKKKKKKVKKERNFTWVVVFSAIIAIFAVFSKTLGMSWLLWTIFTGGCFAILIVLFIVILGS